MTFRKILLTTAGCGCVAVSLSLAAAISIADEAPPREQSPSRRITLENLFQRWTARREAAPAAEAKAPKEQPQQEAETAPAENATAPAPAAVRPAPVQVERAEGEFPAFRANTSAPSQQPGTPAPVRSQQAAAPAPGPSSPPRQSPAVLLSHEAPMPDDISPYRVTLRTDKETAKQLPTAPTPARSTSGYLSDDVRYGHVLRSRTVSAGAPVPAAAPSSVEVPQPATAVAKRSAAAIDPVFPTEASTEKPELVPLRPEDLSALRLPAPVRSAYSSAADESGGQASQEYVSAMASPAALQQALLQGSFAVAANPMAPQQPRPSAPAMVPTPAGEPQQSVLMQSEGQPKFDLVPKPTPMQENVRVESNRPAPSGRPCRGEVLAVDKEHGLIRVDFSKDRMPALGSRMQVFQRKLFKKEVLAEFEVVGVDHASALARPIGKLDLDLILPKDEAVAF